MFELAIVALILALAGAPLTGAAQTPATAQTGSLSPALQLQFADLQKQIAAREQEESGTSPTATAKSQFLKMEAMIQARKGKVASNDGLADQITKAGQLLATSKVDQSARLALYAKIKSALSRTSQEIANMQSSHEGLGATQGTQLKSQLSGIQSFLKTETPAATQDQQNFQQLSNLLTQASAANASLQPAELAKLQAIQEENQAISIGDMFDMQMLMNTLSQLSEMSTAVVNASNTAISAMARNLKD